MRIDTTLAPAALVLDTTLSAGPVAGIIYTRLPATGFVGFSWTTSGRGRMDGGFFDSPTFPNVPPNVNVGMGGLGSNEIRDWPAHAGDYIGFYISASGNFPPANYAQFTLRISGFTAPVVPEPSAASILLAGVGLFICRRYYRRAKPSNADAANIFI
jgi:hypothetical protein